jgi:glycine/D-amino acid oxidase-like deaminating enzyme
VAIVGGGYAGLAAALELARHGVEAVVLEAGALGVGASTRNGGSVSGGVNIGKSFSGRAAEVDPERTHRLLADAADAFSLIERLIAEENIECFWMKRGRFVGAWTRKHYASQGKTAARPQRRCRVGRLHGAARAPARGDRQRLLLWRHGGRALGQPASGALLQGLLDACRRRGIRICAEAAVETIAANGAGWRVETAAARSSPATS